MSRRSRGVTSWALLLVLGLFLTVPAVVLAESSSNHALPYLRMGVGTRALGMGGAYVAAGMDATVGYYNPAGLAWVPGTQIGAMYALGMSDDRGMSFVTASHHFGWGGLGGSLITAGMSDIEGYNAGGGATGNFDYGDMALMLHGAYGHEVIALGGTFKYLHQGLDAPVDGEDGADGWGFDVGALARPLDWLRLGVSLRDLATEIGDDEEANDVPMNLRFGAAIKPLCGFTVAGDLDHVEGEDDLKFHVGTEYAFPLSEDVSAALRLGLNDGNLTAGFGVGVRFVHFGYAFVDEPEDFMGESHRVGLTLAFGQEQMPMERGPRWADADLDGIPNEQDACPGAAEDFDGFEDTDGCPDVDNDGDGILDMKDDCPNQPEDFDGFQDMDGCADADNDGDGIPDAQDKCPMAAETFNSVMDDDGCPDGMSGLPSELCMANINFKFNSAEFTTADPIPVLENIADLMKKNDDMRVRIVGHTDNVGSDAYNQELSERRAEAIKSYLVNKGVSAAHLTTEGRGEGSPITTNDTEEGRARNRRIEFHLVK